MSVRAALRRGRAAAAQLMTDVVVVTRPGVPTFDPGTGKYTPTPPTVLYAGAADVRAMPLAAAQDQAGDREVTTRTYDVKLPFADASDIRLDDTLIASSSNDATLVGLELVVVDVQHGGRRTSRHVIVQDRT